jgi:hypothetical protein
MKNKSSKKAIAVYNEEEFTEDNDPSFREDALGENLLKKGKQKYF